MGHTHFIAVNYHGSGQIGPFLASLRAQSDPDWSAVIIDNSESEAEADTLASLVYDDRNITVHVPGRNLGYFGAARWWRIDAMECEWTVITNVDLQLDPDFVAELAVTDHGQYVTAPAVVHQPGGWGQNPYMLERPTPAAMLLRAVVFSSYLVARLYARASALRSRPASPTTAQEIYAAHGSVMAIHRRYFAAGGTLAHRPFLFGEEISLAEQVAELGGTIRYEPTVGVLHRASQATGVTRTRAMWRHQRAATRHGYALIRARADREPQHDNRRQHGRAHVTE